MNKGCIGFAAYRLPGESSAHLMIQERDEIATDERWSETHQKGFVMIPFCENISKPSIFIRADKTISDNRLINKYLMNFAYEVIRKPYCRTDNYHEAFSKFILALADGNIQKLVLSCNKLFLTSSSPAELFEMASAKYPRLMVYLCYTKQTGLWIGCTPEIILERYGDIYHTIALAGTQKLIEGKLSQKWNAKNIHEQRIVSEYIRQTIVPLSQTFNESAPFTQRAGHLAHLRTDFYFKLRSDVNERTVLKELHPTPAVCGLPKKDAFSFINEHEGYDRRYYAGIIGPIDNEQLNLYVNLRCAEIFRNCLCLYVGSGIVTESEEELEFLEIQEKMKTIKSLL